MGFSDRRPPLPTPTEASSADYGNITSDDLATDVSRRTDRTHLSLPEDGSPVTITTKNKARGDSDAARTNQSQTSLLIEYFEGAKTGKEEKRRPSVRVRVTPSRSKAKEGSDHIQITETGKTHKPSYTRRISLGSKNEQRVPLATGTSDLAHSDVSNSTGPPLEVEVLPNSSDLSRSETTGYGPYGQQPLAASEISSMLPDSMLEGEPQFLSPTRRSPEREVTTETTDTLKAPVTRDRSLSKERELTHRVMERIAQREGGSAKPSSSARRTSSREYVIDDSPSRKRTSVDSRVTEGSTRGPESSLNPSDISRRSERSARSGGSNVSINNPKLLQTVEDAIRRLILPELNAVKEEQRIQRNRSKYEKTANESVSSVRTDEGPERRVSKSSSAPDVKSGKPKVIVSRHEDDISPTKVRRERRSSRASSTSERSRKTSSDTVVRDGDKHRKSSKGKSHVKDVALAAGAGALTAAALRHHDSMSSVDSRETKERRRKRKSSKSRSKSRSRTASMSEMTEDYSRHTESIPPLPMMQSELQSDMTRDSILTADEQRPPSSRALSTPTREFEVRQVTRGSPREVSPASPLTPTSRTPTSSRNQLGTQHRNISGADIHAYATKDHRDEPDEYEEHDEHEEYEEHDEHEEHSSPGHLASAGMAAAGLAGGAAVVSNLHDMRGLHESMSANTLEHYTPQRPLSPIQSVSSYRDSTIGPVEPVQHSRVQSIKSEASLRSPKKSRPVSSRSAGSYASSQSSEFVHSKNRPAGFSLEPGYEIMPSEGEPLTPTHEQHTPRAAEVDDWFDREHEKNERYRHEFDDESELGSGTGYNRDSAYTADSSTLDKVTAGQGVRRVGINPEYVDSPVGVESNVASLHAAPSYASEHSSQASLQKQSAANTLSRDLQETRPGEFGYQEDNSSRERWGALKNQAQASLESQKRQASTSLHSPSAASPAQSEEPPLKMTANALPIPGQQEPVIGHGIDDEELDTNPSIIKGPMAGQYHGDRSHWPYEPTPPIAGHGLARVPSDDRDYGHHAELGAAGLGAGAAAAAVGLGLGRQSKELQQPVEDEYVLVDRDYDPRDSSPAHLKDEGYMSSAQREGYTPEPYANVEDPFRAKAQDKHLSGMSHGMDSPLYDAATGKGMDRIQSKDVVALMDHLTVRDAQRNARDTEILVALVRTAAETRNSFEEMKRFIEAQNRLNMQHTDRDADMVVNRVIGGPRPQPSGSPRAARRTASSEDGGEDSQRRRRNVFNRVLKGISMKSTNDLGRIEDMLIQLLNEVEGLKDVQMRQPTNVGSFNSQEFLRQQQDPGYEPEGQAGTSSTPNQSGFFSTPSSRQLNGGVQPMHSGYDGRRGSGNRISTVIEGDEEDYQNEFPDEERMTTPTQEAQRAQSMPMETPPQQATSNFRASHSAEQTPKTARSSKHRSANSWGLGNFANKVSRWSKTTASTDPQSYRVSTDRPPRPYSEASRSGSNVNVAQYEGQYALNDDDRLRSNGSLAREQQYSQQQQPAALGAEQVRSPSPLIPDNESDGPRYQAHRNSLNLQHPQPRPGPTHRHQSHLESQAQSYYDSLLPEEMDQWGSSPSLALNRNINRISTSTGGNLSPVYSDNASVHSASEQALQQHQNPRQAHIRDDGPLVPSDAASPQPQQQYQQGGQQAFNSSGGSGNAYHATSLEPIQEARYSMETERTGRHLTPSPNPPPTAMQSVQRRITGPRPMGSRSPSASGPSQTHSPARALAQDDSAVRRKPVSVRSTASEDTLQSYRSSLDEDNEIF